MGGTTRGEAGSTRPLFFFLCFSSSGRFARCSFFTHLELDLIGSAILNVWRAKHGLVVDALCHLDGPVDQLLLGDLHGLRRQDLREVHRVLVEHGRGRGRRRRRRGS